jgi:uncharacterized membrane protein YecN with MAPEG domain
MINVALTPDFGYVLAAAATLAFECLLIGMIYGSKGRSEAFDEEFMTNQYGRIHQAEFNKKIEKGGYPDMGSGFYSQKLSYNDWYKFNNCQRAHYNFVESVAATTLMLIVGGLYFPRVAACFGLAIILGRLAFAIGYASGGPRGRTFGAIIIDLCYLGLLVLSIWSSVKFALGHRMV